MIHDNGQAGRAVKRDMNLALDHLLPESEQAALEAHLAESARDASLWRAMRTVDDLFDNASEIHAPPDFASKVMAAVAAMPTQAPVAAEKPLPETSNKVFGVGLGIMIAVPLILAAFLGVQSWASDPAALNTLLQQIVVVLNTITQAVAAIFEMITGYVKGNPIIPALLTTIIPLLMVWGWLMWYTAQRRQQIIYRIPVSAA